MSKLYVVATPIGNLKDITERALNILNESDFILCEDTRNSLNLLNAYGIQKTLVSYHKFNEDERSNQIIQDMLNKDLTVSIITDAGTPCISDPGSYIVEKARKNGIEVYAIPGASAVISSLSVSGFYFTEFSFLGFFPRENKEQKEFVENIKNSHIDTMVFYESPKRIIKTLTYLKESFENLKVICCKEITKKFETYTFGNIDEVLAELIQNENAELGEYAVCIQKSKQEKENKNDISLEAILVDDLIKNGGTIKDSIKRLKDKHNKNALYSASLNLKELFNN